MGFFKTLKKFGHRAGVFVKKAGGFAGEVAKTVARQGLNCIRENIKDVNFKEAGTRALEGGLAGSVGGVAGAGAGAVGGASTTLVPQGVALLKKCGKKIAKEQGKKALNFAEKEFPRTTAVAEQVAKVPIVKRLGKTAVKTLGTVASNKLRKATANKAGKPVNVPVTDNKLANEGDV